MTSLYHQQKLPRILMVHNFYGRSSPSGENQVVEYDFDLLKSKGHEIKLFKKESDEVLNRGLYGYAKAGILNLWNPSSKKIFKKIVSDFKPDLIHIHNTFPLISPSILYIDSINVPIVMTLHNYRIFCPAGILMRNNNICTQCIDKKSIIPSVIHGCYKESRIATIPLAVSSATHNTMKTWNKKIDAFFVLTDYAKNM